MSAYDLLDKSELGGIIEALQRMVSKQADRIIELETILKIHNARDSKLDELLAKAEAREKK